MEVYNDDGHRQPLGTASTHNSLTLVAAPSASASSCNSNSSMISGPSSSSVLKSKLVFPSSTTANVRTILGDVSQVKTTLRPASPLKLKLGGAASTTNRPVKRSTIEPTTAITNTARDKSTSNPPPLPSHPILLGMRSPPPAAKNPFARSKRDLEAVRGAADATTTARPSQRLNSSLAATDFQAKSLRVPSKARSSFDAQKRSAIAVSTSNIRRAFATIGPNNNIASTAAGLFGGPAIGASTSSHDSYYSSQHSKRDIEDLSSTGPASTSGLLSSTLPSDFTPPTSSHFTLSRLLPTIPTFKSIHNAIPSKPSPNTGGLAPSPLRSDEHVPRPPSEPVRHFPTRRSTGSLVDVPNSLTASPRKIQPAFGNPFLSQNERRATIATVHATPASTSPVPATLNLPVQHGANSPKKSSSPASKSSSSSSSSPMQRDDLMRRTIEKAHAIALTYDDEKDTGLAQMVSPVKGISGNRISPTSAPSSTGVLHRLGSYSALSAPHSITERTSPFKRPLPECHSDTTSTDAHQTHKRQKLDLAPEKPARSVSRRQSTRQATTKTSSVPLPPRLETRPRGIQEERSQVELGSSALYRPATAGGSAPITRPTTLRTQSAPVRPNTTKSVDGFKAPLYQPAVADTEEGNSGDTLDADTSIMSLPGQASLASLQSLLSKFSSRQSLGGRRMSTAFARTHEGEQKPLSNGDTGMLQDGLPIRPVSSAIPRYASATSSSSARQAKSSHEALPDSLASNALHEARKKPPTRRVSGEGPAPRRGSLLPVAANSNAARNAWPGSSSNLSLRHIVRPDTDASTNTGAASATDASTLPKTEKSRALKDVVAFVDVKTAEGDEAGGLFVDILRSLGARVLARPTDSITHMIFKGGRPATIQRYRAYTKDPKPFLVGVGWIVRCREINEKVDEAPFVVNPDSVDGGLLMSKFSGQAQQATGTSGNSTAKGARRKTLEPRVRFPASGSSGTNLPPGQMSLHAFGILASDGSGPDNAGQLERVRQKTMKFAPRIGSPLKQRVFNAFEGDEDAAEVQPLVLSTTSAMDEMLA